MENTYINARGFIPKKDFHLIFLFSAIVTIEILFLTRSSDEEEKITNAMKNI
jgi:hypothetical protein